MNCSNMWRLLVLAFLPVTFPVAVADQASWYGEQLRGLRMANGQRFNPDRLTAASWFYPLGSKVVVTHACRSVVVEITDRGPAKRLVNAGRKIDLSRAAFAKLAAPERGLIEVVVKNVAEHDRGVDDRPLPAEQAHLSADAGVKTAKPEKGLGDETDFLCGSDRVDGNGERTNIDAHRCQEEFR